MSDDLFVESKDPAENEIPKFEDLVGEGKKYRDNDAAAKAITEKDRFIGKLQEELEELRTEVRSRLNMEELVDSLRASKDSGEMNSHKPQEPGSREPEKAPETKEVDIQEEVLRLMKQEKTREDRERNIHTVREGLKDRFGSDYNQRLEDIATEMGVAKGFLTDMAAMSPAGFLKLIDSVAPAEDRRTASPPQSTVDTQKAFNTGSRKNRAYYRELRERDPKQYFSKKTQREMHDEAMRQGAKFYE